MVCCARHFSTSHGLAEPTIPLMKSRRRIISRSPRDCADDDAIRAGIYDGWNGHQQLLCKAENPCPECLHGVNASVQLSRHVGFTPDSGSIAARQRTDAPGQQATYGVEGNYAPLKVAERNSTYCKGLLNNPSFARRGVTQYDFGHLQIVAIASFTETFRDTVTILHLAILAHLPLAFEPRNGKAEAYDAAQHGFYVSPGRIRRRPAPGSIFSCWLVSSATWWCSQSLSVITSGRP